MRYAINGLLSLTCDGNPILGESEVDGLWTAAAVWIKEGPGVGRAVAEWMTDGHSEIDLHHSDIARFHPHQKRREHTRLRTTESFIKTYGIVHPAEQYESDRDQRLAPMHDVAEEARRGLLRDRRLGAAVLVRVQRRPARGVRRRGDAARARVGLPLVEPDHQRRAPAHARGGGGDRPVGVLHLRHRRARARSTSVQGTCVAQCDVAVGKVVYTPGARREGRLPLRPHGDAAGRRPLPGRHRRRARHGRPQPGSPTTCPTTAPRRSTDLTDDVSTIGIWGPRARDILASLTVRRRLRRRASASSPAARSRSRARPSSPPASPTSASSAGSSTSRWSTAAELWEALLEAGAPHGAVPVGIGVYGTTGRIEKGYRAYGVELDGERTHHRGRHAAAEGQGGRLRRPGGLPRAARAAPATRAVHADRRRPHLGQRRAALHARRRADPDPRRRHAHRRPRPPPVRHHPPAPRRRSASTCCWPTCRPTRPSSATSSPSPTWRSSTRSPSARSTPPRCSTRPTSGSRLAMTNVAGLRQAGRRRRRARSC